MAAITLNDLLYEMQTYTDEAGEFFPQVKHLSPSDDQIVDIDLNTREIKAPKFLSVQYDHNAEIIYFRCNRYYDNMDLANTVCVIQYLNAEHIEMNPDSPNVGKKTRDAGIYWVPYYDLDHWKAKESDPSYEDPTILIPWAVGGLATAYEGTVTYSGRFYRLGEDDEHTYLYNMSTKPAKGEVLWGIGFYKEDGTVDEAALQKFQIESTVVDQIYHKLSLVESLAAEFADDATTYWVDA